MNTVSSIVIEGPRPFLHFLRVKKQKTQQKIQRERNKKHNKKIVLCYYKSFCFIHNCFCAALENFIYSRFCATVEALVLFIAVFALLLHCCFLLCFFHPKKEKKWT